MKVKVVLPNLPNTAPADFWYQTFCCTKWTLSLPKTSCCWCNSFQEETPREGMSQPQALFSRTLLQPSRLNSEKRIQAFKIKCVRKLLSISYLEHKTNDCVQSKYDFLVSPREPLLATVKRRTLAQFGHITRHDRLSKTILRGNLERGRRRGRQKKY